MDLTVPVDNAVCALLEAAGYEDAEDGDSSYSRRSETGFSSADD